MRADAARNVHRIVEVAARLLGDDPHAGMNEVAEAAAVSRATVYRHFASREALLEAIWEQAAEQAGHAVSRCRLDEGNAIDALRRLVFAWLEIAERYSFSQLAAQPELNRSREAREHRRRVFAAPLLGVIARGQAAGEFNDAISAEWFSRVFGTVILAAVRAVGDGSLSREEAPDVVVRTLLDGLRA